MSNLQDLMNRPLPTIRPLVVKEGWELKKLSQKHKTIIALHIQNMSRADIATVAGCTPEYVSMIIRQPIAQAYFKDLEGYMDDRLRMTYGKAVDALVDCLDSEDEDVKLRASKLALEANGKLLPKPGGNQTAEDLVASILANATNVIIGQNVQVVQHKDIGDANGSDQQHEKLLDAP